MLAVDGLGENTGAGGFTHTAGATEQVCVGKVLVFNGILQRGGDVLLTNNGVEGLGAVFSR